MLKHLLRTSSFAKTFIDANDYDSNKYVNIVKHMIVLTKLRNSQNVSFINSLININYSAEEQLLLNNLKSLKQRMF